MKSGIELIAKERHEQIEKHGRSVESDAAFNGDGQLLDGIMLLISNVAMKRMGIELPKEAFEDLKPDTWGREACWKLMAKPEIEQLQIIGAFAAAEIDRLLFNNKKPF